MQGWVMCLISGTKGPLDMASLDKGLWAYYKNEDVLMSRVPVCVWTLRHLWHIVEDYLESTGKQMSLEILSSSEQTHIPETLEWHDFYQLIPHSEE